MALQAGSHSKSGCCDRPEVPECNSTATCSGSFGFNKPCYERLGASAQHPTPDQWSVSPKTCPHAEPACPAQPSNALVLRPLLWHLPIDPQFYLLPLPPPLPPLLLPPPLLFLPLLLLHETVQAHLCMRRGSRTGWSRKKRAFDL
jgi:hypothetical protein